MKQNKLAIVVLIVLAVLFVLGMGSNLFRDKKDKDNELSMRKAGDLKNRWIGSMESAMAPFRSALDSGRLKKRSNCQTGDKTYKLTDQDECYIIIERAKDGAEFEKAIVAVQEANVKVSVPYPDDEPCPITTRGSAVSFSTFKQPKAITGIAKIKPDKFQADASQQSLELSVVYIPAGGKEKKAKCEVTEDVSLMVLEEGGKLKLQCKGCNQKQDRTVTVTLN
jgi:hypothetical protein